MASNNGCFPELSLSVFCGACASGVENAYSKPLYFSHLDLSYNLKFNNINNEILIIILCFIDTMGIAKAPPRFLQ